MNTVNEPRTGAWQRVQAVCGRCFTTNRVPRARLEDDPRCGQCGERLLDGEPVPLDNNSIDPFVAKNDLPVVIDFWAGWCAPCRMIAPAFDSVARDLKSSVRFAKVDVDASAAVARSFSVSSIPTLVLFQDGKEVRRVAGVMSATQLRSWINAAE